MINTDFGPFRWMATGITFVLAFSFFQIAHAADDKSEEIIAHERSLAASVVSLDFETLDRIYADDFVFSHSTGVVETKKDWLDFLGNNQSFYKSRDVDSIKVELHGDVAVTSGRLHIKTSSEDPRRREFTIWYIRVYEQRENNWQLISHRSIREEFGPLPD